MKEETVTKIVDVVNDAKDKYDKLPEPVKEAGKEVAKQAAKKAAKKVAEKAPQLYNLYRGIFNDPEFWISQLANPDLAQNSTRPMTPESLLATGISEIVTIMSAVPMGSLNIRFNDPRETTAFKLACSEMFKAIRTELKTNLPYTQETVEAYFCSVLEVLIKYYDLKRSVSLKDFYDAQNPQWNNMWRRIDRSGNQAAIGMNGMQLRYPYDTYENEAQLMIKWPILKRVADGLYVPRQLSRFLNWIAGVTFMDQSGNTPQYYFCNVVESPTYTISSGSNPTVVNSSTTTMTEIKIDELISAFTAINDTYGMVLADIAKVMNKGDRAIHTFEFDKIVIEDEPWKKKPCFYKDAEFFDIIENAYCFDYDSAYVKAIIKDNDYARIDYSDLVFKSPAMIGTWLALGKLAKSTGGDYSPIIEPVSFSAYVAVAPNMAYPLYSAVKYDNAGDSKAMTMLQSNLTSEYKYITYTIDGMGYDSFYYSHIEPNQASFVGPNANVPQDTRFTGKIQIPSLKELLTSWPLPNEFYLGQSQLNSSIYPSEKEYIVPYYEFLVKDDGDFKHAELRFNFSTDFVTVDGVKFRPCKGLTILSGDEVSNTTFTNLDDCHNIRLIEKGPGDTIHIVNDMRVVFNPTREPFRVFSLGFTNAFDIGNNRFEFEKRPELEVAYDVAKDRAEIVASGAITSWLGENFDYFIPYLSFSQMVDEINGAAYQTVPSLCKEVSHSTVINRKDLPVTYYQMRTSLLRMVSSKTK